MVRKNDEYNAVFSTRQLHRASKWGEGRDYTPTRTQRGESHEHLEDSLRSDGRVRLHGHGIGSPWGDLGADSGVRQTDWNPVPLRASRVVDRAQQRDPGADQRHRHRRQRFDG